jgi:hypothetical protein
MDRVKHEGNPPDRWKKAAGSENHQALVDIAAGAKVQGATRKKGEVRLLFGFSLFPRLRLKIRVAQLPEQEAP